jgi:glycogen debranching enzyme
MATRWTIAAVMLVSAVAVAQKPVGVEGARVDSILLREDGPVLRQAVRNGEPFTVAGPLGVIVGKQQGVFEAWILPVKLLSQLTIEAKVQGEDVPLDLNSFAREIEVRPDHTTITYAHPALTVRQTMFSPEDSPQGTGTVVLFQVDAVHPVNLVFSFKPEMLPMWPAPGSGTTSAEWIADGATGLYLLHTDSAELAGAVALPGATHEIAAVSQGLRGSERLELHLHVDPTRDRGKIYSLLMAVGRNHESATREALQADLQKLDEKVGAIYAAHVKRYREEEDTRTVIETPDEALDANFGWAETAIEQLRAKAQPSGETGLVAGYFTSGDTARPGFGWFFGRDALYKIYALDSFGDFQLTRDELEFLMHRQRDDGKIMHEYSQMAAYVDWKALPYEYAAADATPLFLTAMLDYVRSSGDVAFLRNHRDAVLKAWQFETTHDRNGDGIYDNAQGTGWVESWPPGMPQQEIYLALLDQQASEAMAQLGDLLQADSIALEAKQRAKKVQVAIEREYYVPSTQQYAFSQNGGGELDKTETVYPAIAWWNGGEGLEHPAASLRAWASHDFATDWGLRDIAATDPLYDGLSYHQGSVWPLFTGWEAMAQYRSGHALAGYQTTMENVDLTDAQDLGAVTELISGDFFVPFGRSTSHQLWSSAMVIIPVMRGLFGVEVDGLHHTISVAPHLPAQWRQAEIKHLHVGESTVNLRYSREKGFLVLSVEQVSGPAVFLAGAGARGKALQIPLPAFEVGIRHGLPLPGARTAQMKVLKETVDGHSLRLELEGMAGSESLLSVCRNDSSSPLHVQGAEVEAETLHVHFPSGSGYVSKTVTLTW